MEMQTVRYTKVDGTNHGQSECELLMQYIRDRLAVSEAKEERFQAEQQRITSSAKRAGLIGMVSRKIQLAWHCLSHDDGTHDRNEAIGSAQAYLLNCATRAAVDQTDKGSVATNEAQEFCKRLPVGCQEELRHRMVATAADGASDGVVRFVRELNIGKQTGGSPRHHQVQVPAP